MDELEEELGEGEETRDDAEWEKEIEAMLDMEGSGTS